MGLLCITELVLSNYKNVIPKPISQPNFTLTSYKYLLVTSFNRP